MIEKIKSAFQNKQVMYVYITLFLLACIYVGAISYFAISYGNRFYPGVKIYGVSVSGKSKQEAREILQGKTKSFLEGSLVFSGQKQYTAKASDLDLMLGLEENLDKAYRLGRNDDYNPWKIFNHNFAEYSLGVDKTVGFFEKIEEGENVGVKESTVSVTDKGVLIKEGVVGKKLKFSESILTFKKNIRNLEITTDLVIEEIYPQVTADSLNGLMDKINETLSEDLAIVGPDQRYVISKKEIADFIYLEKEQPKSKSPGFIEGFDWQLKGQSIIGFDREKIKIKLSAIFKNFDTSPKNLSLGFENNALVVRSKSVDGRKLETESLVERVASSLKEGIHIVDMPVSIVKAEINEDNLNQLGIKSLISTGYSDFTGSPVNRIHNVRNGASKFNGIIIRPGEEFSFNTALGPVEASTGYLPELVILQDKTEKQYGGGLCQVSSTAFRAALNAGLPIIERRAHAYPVQYYKPYGVDATIYLPKPDLVFKNDTPGHILVQTRIEGKKLYFDFYGTKKEGSVKFAGNKDGTYGPSDIVEKMSPTIYDQEVRGRASFTAVFYRFIYDAKGTLVTTSSWTSKYDSPDKYPH